LPGAKKYITRPLSSKLKMKQVTVGFLLFAVAVTVFGLHLISVSKG
jgi:hypothetical protein